MKNKRAGTDIETLEGEMVSEIKGIGVVFQNNN